MLVAGTRTSPTPPGAAAPPRASPLVWMQKSFEVCVLVRVFLPLVEILATALHDVTDDRRLLGASQGVASLLPD